MCSLLDVSSLLLLREDEGFISTSSKWLQLLDLLHLGRRSRTAGATAVLEVEEGEGGGDVRAGRGTSCLSFPQYVGGGTKDPAMEALRRCALALLGPAAEPVMLLVLPLLALLGSVWPPPDIVCPRCGFPERLRTRN